MKKLAKNQLHNISGGLQDGFTNLADELKDKGQISDECAFILPILWRIHSFHGIPFNQHEWEEVQKAGCDVDGFVNYLNALTERVYI